METNISSQVENIFMSDHPIRLERSQRWVRVKFNDKFIAGSRQPQLLLIYGKHRSPGYYFDVGEVSMENLTPSDWGEMDEVFGPTRFWHLQVGERIAANAAWSYTDPPAEFANLKDKISFLWKKMDAWYEEEEEVFVHPRDPYKRVDVIPSSRRLRVEMGGLTILETERPYLLFETDLPVRYYVPREDVRMDLLTPSSRHTSCPYKGDAEYWSLKLGDKVHKDILWSYPDPIPEAPKIKGLISFYNEKVDITLDGELQPRPVTPWS